MSSIRPRRSALYMPGSNPRALDKARTLDVDMLIFDLEDAVAPQAKLEARHIIRDALARGGYGPREVLVRINALSTPPGADDLAMAVHARPEGVLVPKVSTVDELEELDARMDALGAPKSFALWAMIETPLAILNLREIAAYASRPTSRLKGFVMGTNDLARETGARLLAGRAPMTSWLMMALAAAHAYGLLILDGVFNDIYDDEGFASECRQGRDFGFDGKTVIHPRQIEAANQAFSPSADEVMWAQAICKAFDLPENAGRNAIKVDGKMVERLHMEMAGKLLAIHHAITARDHMALTA